MTSKARIPIARAYPVAAAFCVLAGWTDSTISANEPGGADGADPLPINACALLSSAAVSAATGFSAGPGVRRDAGYQSTGAYSSTCVWLLEREGFIADPAAPLGGRSFVILNAMRWPEGSGLAGSFLQDFRDAAARGEIPRKPAPRNFGDEALWWGDGLAVRKGDVSFGLSVVLRGIDTGRPGEIEERLAPNVLRQLENPAD